MKNACSGRIEWVKGDHPSNSYVDFAKSAWDGVARQLLDVQTWTVPSIPFDSGQIQTLARRRE